MANVKALQNKLQWFKVKPNKTTAATTGIGSQLQQQQQPRHPQEHNQPQQQQQCENLCCQTSAILHRGRSDPWSCATAQSVNVGIRVKMNRKW